MIGMSGLFGLGGGWCMRGSKMASHCGFHLFLVCLWRVHWVSMMLMLI